MLIILFQRYIYTPQDGLTSHDKLNISEKRPSFSQMSGTTQEQQQQEPANQQRRADPRRKGPRGRGPRGPPQKEWIPKTKLGRLVKEGHIDLETIFYHAIPIKEHEIVDTLLAGNIKEEIMKIMSVQKQTRAGQRTRFKAIAAVGDQKGHIGVGIKTAAECANAIRGAAIYARLSIIPVRFGYWGNRIGEPHTVPCTVTGKCGSIRMRLIPAPRGSGVVAGSVAKRLLHMAGFHDLFTSSIGNTKTTFNFIVATYNAMVKTYKYLTPDLWGVDLKTNEPNADEIKQHPFVEHAEYLKKAAEEGSRAARGPKKGGAQRRDRPQGRPAKPVAPKV